MTAANGSAPGDEIRLSVPASLEYVRIVRLTTSAMASRLGFDVDEIENWRVAVDELSSTILEGAPPGGELTITMFTTGSDFCIEGQAPIGNGSTIELDQLTAQILNAVCDKYELRVADDAARFVCVRRLPTN
jgi:serine/threonine-protein kinase RsbW